MTDFVTVKVHGLEELERELNTLPEQFAKTALRTATRKASQIVQREGAARAPVSGLPIPRGGRKQTWRKLPLHRAIRIRTQIKSLGVKGAEISAFVTPDKSAWYGRLLEFGTKFMGERKFLGPAYEATKNRLIDVFKLELSKAISRVRVKHKLPTP